MRITSSLDRSFVLRLLLVHESYRRIQKHEAKREVLRGRRGRSRFCSPLEALLLERARARYEEAQIKIPANLFANYFAVIVLNGAAIFLNKNTRCETIFCF